MTSNGVIENRRCRRGRGEKGVKIVMKTRVGGSVERVATRMRKRSSRKGRIRVVVHL